MIELLAPISTITISTPLPEIVRSCLLTPIAPEQEPEVQEIWLPTAPGITYNSLPEPPEIIDTSPDQIVGCIEDTGSNPQIRLNALFPTPLEGDGVVERLNNDIWVYRGSEWVNVGPTPGPTIAIEKVIPFWNEKVSTIASTKTFVSVLKYAYSLNLSTEVTLPTKTSLLAKFAKLVKLQNPVNVNIAAEVPAIPVNVLVNTTGISVGIEQIFVSSGSSSILPVSIVACESIIPVVSSGYTASIPGVSISAEGLIAESIGYRAYIDIEEISLSIVAEQVSIQTSASILIDPTIIVVSTSAASITTGASVKASVINVNIETSNAIQVGDVPIIDIDTTGIIIDSLVPILSTGASIAPNSASINIASQLPIIAIDTILNVSTSTIALASGSPEVTASIGTDYWSSWTEQTYGWDADTYRDGWAN